MASSFALEGRERTRRLLTALIKQLLGLEEGSQNFDTAIRFSEHILKHHSYLDTNPTEVLRLYARLGTRMEINAQQARADQLRSLIGLLEKQRSPSAFMDANYALLCLLYYLAESPLKADYDGQDLALPSVTEQQADLLSDSEESDLEDSLSSSTDLSDWTDIDSNADISARETELHNLRSHHYFAHADAAEHDSFDWQSMHMSFPQTSEVLSTLHSNTKQITVTPYPSVLAEGLSCTTGASSTVIEALRSQEYGNNVALLATVPRTRVTEPALVEEVLAVLQGLPCTSFAWDATWNMYRLESSLCLSHLSDASLQSLLAPFLGTAAALKRMQHFVNSVSVASIAATCARGEGVAPGPTIEAFANAMLSRIQAIRHQVKVEAAACLSNTPSACTTLLGLSSRLQPIMRAVEVLEYVQLQGAPPGGIFVESAAAGCSHILGELYHLLEEHLLSSNSQGDIYCEALHLWLRSMLPLLESLDLWLLDGTLNDNSDELFVYRSGPVNIEDNSFWTTSFSLRRPEHSAVGPPRMAPVIRSRSFNERSGIPGDSDQPVLCPSFLSKMAEEILAAGKSLQLLHYHADSADMNTQPNTHVLYSRICKSLKTLMVVATPAPGHMKDIASADSSASDAWSVIEESSQVPADGDKPLGIPSTSGRAMMDSTLEDDGWLTVDGQLASADQDSGQEQPSSFLMPMKQMPLDFRLVIPTIPHQEQDLTADATAWLKDLVVHAPPPMSAIDQCLLKPIHELCENIGLRLLKRLMGEWHLLEELQALRAVYLLGSGDVLSQFTSEVFAKLDRHEPWHDIYELQTLLEESTRFASDAHLPLNAIQLHIEPDQQGTGGFDIDALDAISILYQVRWPVGMIVDANSMTTYNSVMRFLFKVKRAKHALDGICCITWKMASAKQCRTRATQQRLLLQAELMHFVNNLHQYVMDRVLHTAWAELAGRLAGATTLEDVRAAHGAYLESIERQCLVAPDRLWTLIAGRVKTILGLVLDFCAACRQLADGLDGVPVKVDAELRRIRHEFHECNAFLLRVLTSKLKVGHFPHLVDLVTRINFNNFYISEQGNHVTVT